MYILTSAGRTPIAFSETKEDMKLFIESLLNYELSEYRRKVNESSWFRDRHKHLADSEYIGRIFQHKEVYKIKTSASTNPKLGFLGVEKSDSILVTEEFLTFKTEEKCVGSKITALVSKKSLKSYNTRVEVLSEVGSGSITDAGQLKELVDKLTRISVMAPSWGKMTLSPDSLTDVESTPIFREVRSVVLIKE